MEHLLSPAAADTSFVVFSIVRAYFERARMHQRGTRFAPVDRSPPDAPPSIHKNAKWRGKRTSTADLRPSCGSEAIPHRSACERRRLEFQPSEVRPPHG